MKAPPLLLKRGADSIGEQVYFARWDLETDGFENLFVCRVDPFSGEAFPRFLTHRDGRPRETVGCIEVIRRKVPTSAWREGDWSAYTAQVLFVPGAFKEAWHAARKLRHARKNRPALFRHQELIGIVIRTTYLMPAMLVHGYEGPQPKGRGEARRHGGTES